MAPRIQALLALTLAVSCSGAFSNASVSGDVLNGTDYRHVDPIVASGSASGPGYSLFSFADLSSGVLKASASAAARASVGTRNSAEARIDEGFTFTGGYDQTAYVDFRFHGAIYSGASGANLGGLNVIASNGPGRRFEEIVALRETQSSCDAILVPKTCIVGSEIDYVGSLAIPVSTGAWSFTARVVAFAADGGFANFENTASLYLRLPEGVSVSSSSGQFLALANPVITSPVPEPETWALLAAGFGLLGWRHRGHGASAQG